MNAEESEISSKNMTFESINTSIAKKPISFSVHEENHTTPLLWYVCVEGGGTVMYIKLLCKL